MSAAAFGQTLLLEHATVIDATGAPPRPDVSVLVRDGRIASIAPNIERPPGAVLIDARGKFLIPGLWDMHAHLDPPDRTARRMVAWGVTGLREMYTNLDPHELNRWRNQGHLPRVVISALLDGPLLKTAGPLPPGSASVGTPEDARIAVQALSALGVDFLKVYNSLPHDVYLAAADEARRIGTIIAGHVPEAVSPAEAAQVGQLSQEHLINILLACSTNEDELRAERVKLMTEPDPSISAAERARRLGFPEPEGLFDTYDKEKCAALFETFADWGVWQTPTLVMFKHFADGGPEIRALPFMQDLDDTEFAAFTARVKALFERYLQLVGDMHRADVHFLAGTDTSTTTTVAPGVGLHEELELLVQAGLSPMEALRTATYNAGFYIGILTLMGTLEQGKIADIVVLDANPLDDIRNTRKISGVVMRGVYFPRATLDAYLTAN